MADEFNTTINWWESSSSSRNRFDNSTASPSSSSLGLGGGTFTWPPPPQTTEIAGGGGQHVKARSSLQSSVQGSSDVFHDTQKLQHHAHDHHHHHHHDPGSDLQMMGLGLSSHANIDWNQAVLRGSGDKPDPGFHSMLRENLNSSSSRYQQETGIESTQIQWTTDQRLFTGDATSMKQQGGFSLDPQFSSHGSSSDSTATNFQMDSSGLYGNASAMLLANDNTQTQQFQYGSNYGFGNESSLGGNCWPNKVSQLLRNNSPPKQQQHVQSLHFSNNAPFWNASASAMTDMRPSFFPLQPPFSSSSVEEKQQIKCDQGRESNTTVKKSGSDSATKRPRNESQTTLPAFKVRKEKMGDRITALQQLVSPFGKTDTASVLSEAIEYIKFLHDQVSMLSTPYMKSGAPIHHQQNSEKAKDQEGQKQDLKSRGLCLVPVSSTFPVTHESTVDFWTPTFGGTFR